MAGGGGGGELGPRALAGGGPLPGEAQTQLPITPRQGRRHLETQPEHLPSQSEPDAQPAGGELGWAQGRLPAAGGREGAAEPGEAGGRGAAA